MAQDVTDKPAERYLNWQVIIQSGILGIMGWVGINIDKIKENIGQLNTVSQVNRTSIKNNSIGIEKNALDIRALRDRIEQLHTQPR